MNGIIIFLICMAAVLISFLIFAYYYYHGRLWDGKLSDSERNKMFRDCSPGHHIYILGKVKFHVEIPEQIRESVCGLIIDMHGASMNAQQEDDGTNMRELGRKYGYVIVQPECPKIVVVTKMDEPVVYMIHLLIEELNIDKRRIHMTGFSMGGMMTWRFIRDQSDLLASAAPMSGAPWNAIVDPPCCKFEAGDLPSKEIPILHMQGTKDNIVSYKSAIRLRDNIVKAWNLNEKELVSGDEMFRRYRYTNDSGMEYEFIEHDYSSNAPFIGKTIGGHCFPGGKEVYDPKHPVKRIPFGSQDKASFYWGEEVMKFFIEHPKNPISNGNICKT